MKKCSGYLLRKAVVLLLSVLMLFNCCFSALAVSYAGDIDNDGALRANDLVDIRNAFLETEDFTDSEFVAKYDVNGDGVVDARDIVNLKKEVAYFVEEEKFEAIEVNEIGNSDAVLLSELFTVKDGANINSARLNVEVDTVDSGITYEINADTENWENSSILFKGTGNVTVTVSEYCIPTSITFELVNEVKFAKNDSAADEYGNASIITVGALFSALDGYDIDSSKVDVTAETNSGNVTCEIVLDTENWQEGKLEFDGTGSITLTITEESEPTSVTITVVNADKFTLKVDDPYTVKNTENVILGDIFAELAGVDVDSDKVAVSIEKVNQEDTVTWNFTEDKTDWTKGVIDFSGKGQLTVTIEEDSNPTTLAIIVEPIDKFVAVEGLSLAVTETLTLGQLFTQLDGVTVDSSKVKVEVTGGTYTADTTDWKNGTITFTEEGTATVTIEEDSNSVETTVTVIKPVQKFAVNFTNTDKYLYRVGNANTVALGSLFSGIEGTDIGTVDVTVETLNGTAASGTFTANSDWTKATIQFNGTGVVKVTITDNYYCIPTELMLEVVDAKNATSAASATANNVVLLNDVSGTISVSNGFTFYGNGFSITLPKGTVTNKGNGFVGFINLSGGHLDNLSVIGPVFPEQYIYRSQAEITSSSDPDYGDGYNMRYFHNSVIINSGDCRITNCYISGSRTGICVKNGDDVLIENTTVSGGAYANIQVIAADSVVFKDITTQQFEVEDSYNAEGSKKNIIGLGIVIDDNETEIYFEGSLKQSNWICQSQWNNLLGSYVNQFPEFFTDSTYSKYWHYRAGDSSTKYVNLTCIFACEWNSSKLHDNRTDKTIPYSTADITVANMNGAVYSVSNAGTLTDELFYASDYVPSAQYAVAPSFEFDYLTEENYVAATEGSNEYCYEDAGVVKISFDEGNSKVWYTSILTVDKGGKSIPYTVTMDGTDYTNGSITFTTAGNYTVVYTYTDTYNYKLDENGNIVAYDKTYTATVNITVSVVEETAKNAEFTMGSNGQAVEKKLINNSVYLSASGITAPINSGTGLKFPRSDGDTSTISFKYSGNTTGSWASATIDGETFYFPVVAMTTTDNKFNHTGSWYGCFPVFEGAISITDYANGGTGEAVTYNGSTTTLPSTMAALYPQTVFRYQGTASKVPTTPSKMTKGGSSGKLCYTTQTDLSASNERGEEWNLATYTYVDNKGTTYYWYVAYYCAASTNGSCVTPDTLVTLADGSQVRVDSLTGNEELLVWNHETGSFDKAPVAYIVNHDEQVSEKEIIHLYFSNGSEIRIIGEHVFFDATLGKYVAIDAANVEQYISHKFIGLDESLLEIELVKAEKYKEITSAYEVVSYKHLTCFTNNILSTSAYLDKLLNIFDIDLSTMAYTAEEVQKDIETYGLYTYADFEDLISEEAFELYNAKYLKVAVGKGYITWNDILDLIDIYFDVDVQPIN